MLGEKLSLYVGQEMPRQQGRLTDQLTQAFTATADLTDRRYGASTFTDEPRDLKVRVLVVDDSAFMRKSLTAMLEEGKQIQVVGVARNGEKPFSRCTAEPDVVTMDVEMPGMTGLQALQQIMAKHPVPVIMVSSITIEGAQETLQALEWGAVDFVPKQLAGVASKIAEIQKLLVSKVLEARHARSKMRATSAAGQAKMAIPPAKSLSSFSVSVTRGTKLIAIGCSTGGPQALFEIMPMIPADCPPVSSSSNIFRNRLLNRLRSD